MNEEQEEINRYLKSNSVIHSFGMAFIILWIVSIIKHAPGLFVLGVVVLFVGVILSFKARQKPKKQEIKVEIEEAMVTHNETIEPERKEESN